MGNVCPLFSSCPVFPLPSKQQKERIQVKIKVVKIKFVEFVPSVVKFLNFLPMPVGWRLKVKLLVLEQARLTKAEAIKHTKSRAGSLWGFALNIEGAALAVCCTLAQNCIKIHGSEFLYPSNCIRTPDNREFLHIYAKIPQAQQAPSIVQHGL